jgi:Proprotein convertase P-domain
LSPTGTESHLCTKRKLDASSDGMWDWYFMSVKHWYVTIVIFLIAGVSRESATGQSQ